MEYQGWMKIDSANKGTWTVWRRVRLDGSAVFQVCIAPMIPRDDSGRGSLETLLAMKGLTRDYIQVYP